MMEEEVQRLIEELRAEFLKAQENLKREFDRRLQEEINRVNDERRKEDRFLHGRIVDLETQVRDLTRNTSMLLSRY